MRQREINALREYINQSTLNTRACVADAYGLKPTDLEDALTRTEDANKKRAKIEAKRRNTQ